MIIKKEQLNDFIIWIQTKGFSKVKEDKENMGFISVDKTTILQIMKNVVTSYSWDGATREDKPEIVNGLYLEFEKEISPTVEVQEVIEVPKSVIPAIGTINNIPAILDGRIITAQDIEEWKKKSVFERLTYFQKTPKNLIKKRRGFLLQEFSGRDKKTLTDDHYQMYSYVEGNIMNTEANIAFLFEWSAVVESEKWFTNDLEVSVRGYVQVKINGEQIRRPCGGSCIKKGNMEAGDMLETAITEMKKRGLKSFGFNRDIYSTDTE